VSFVRFRAPLQWRFAPWVGALIGDQKPILLVTDLGLEEETVTRLTRVGFDNVIGHLKMAFKLGQPQDMKSIR
jgi:hypothetical protein